MNPFNPQFYTPFAASTYSYGRAALALAQLTVLLFTPEWALTVPVGDTGRTTCAGLENLSAYCVGGGDTGFWVGRAVSVVVLLSVICGWRPRWTSVPHAWVTVSFLHAISLPDGGEAVLATMTILLIPLCLADSRRWAWPATSPDDDVRTWGRRDGIAAAVQWALRAQVAGIYFHSALAKLAVPDWVNGSAMYYVTREHFFGATGFVGDIMRAITDTAFGTATLTWGTVLVESLIAVCILGTVRLRRVAVILAVALHVGIIIVLGLWSFGIVMCGAVFVAASLPSSALRLPPQRSRPQAASTPASSPDLEFVNSARVPEYTASPATSAPTTASRTEAPGIL